MISVPKSLERLALEIEGWLELHNPELALSKLGPLLKTPGGRATGLFLRTRALVELQRIEEALASIDTLGSFDHDPDWFDLTRAWCLKRTGRVSEAAECMERLIARSHRSAIGHYNLGCYLALLGTQDRAIDEVALACGIESEFRRHAVQEADLDSLRGNPRFDALLHP